MTLKARYLQVQGADIVKASPLRARFVFIAPPSLTILEERLRGRGTEAEDKVSCECFEIHKRRITRLAELSGVDLVLPPCRCDSG
eukprot:scaffold254907_cov31-Tisochrysis_lutea.AAC.2